MISTTNFFQKLVSFLRMKRLEISYNNKIQKLLSNFQEIKINDNLRNNIRSKYAEYGYKKVSLKWHKFYISVTNLNHFDYVPETIFYCYIEPALNKTDLYRVWEDKSLLDKFLDSKLTPKILLKNCNGIYYIEENIVSFNEAIKYCTKFEEFIIKPSMGTYGGEGVKRIELVKLKNINQDLGSLFSEYKSDFILQEVIKQSPAISKLNPSSINTIRVISYLKTPNVIPLSAVIRIGKKGHVTDNIASGGIACGINMNGSLNKEAVNKFGLKYKKTESGVALEGYQIPEFEKIIETVKKEHKKLPHFKLVSWDITVNEKSEIKIIEFNTCGQDINLHQMTNGPLFGNHFDEILKLSKNI